MADVGSKTADILPPHPPEPVDMAAIAAAAIAEVTKDEQSTAQIVANVDEANVPPPPLASTSSPQARLLAHPSPNFDRIRCVA